MIGSTNRKPRAAPNGATAAVPNGVKVIPAPKSAASRKLLSESDIASNGVGPVVHFKHFLGISDQIFFIMDIFPSADPGGYCIEILPIPAGSESHSPPKIESIHTTMSTRQEAQEHRRTTYEQAVIEATTRATTMFQHIQSNSAVSECKAKFANSDFQRPDFRFEVIEVPDWKKKLQQLRREGKIGDEWIRAITKKTQSKSLRAVFCELIGSFRSTASLQ